MLSTLSKFFTVCLSETYDCTVKVTEIIDWKITSIKGYFKIRKEKKELKKNMKHSTSYSEWKEYAQKYDKLKDIQIWKETNETSLFDWEYIKNLTDCLIEARSNEEFKKVMLLIRSNSVRNVANILNPALYSKSFIGTKHLIEEFQKEVVLCLEYIATLPEDKVSQKLKTEFFAETRHAFGKTALIFSGGANMGLYHYGVAKCLYEEGMLPRIIAGSSIGSIFASFICTRKLEDLKHMFTPENIDLKAFLKQDQDYPLFRKLRRLIYEGYFLDNSVIKEFVRDNIGDVTFQEAYDKTGWILNITVTGYGEHDGYRLLNYLTAPNVLIWSAVCASCAIPYVYGPCDLFCKNEEGQIEHYIPGSRKFLDGSIMADLPVKNLSEMFNVNYFLVSQTNPWVVPFMNHSESYRHHKRRFLLRLWEFIKDVLGSEIKHRINQLGKIGLFSKAVTRYFNLITQQYGGHVTIWPNPTLNDFVHLIDNPCHTRLRYCLVKGATRVYHRVNHIASVLVIERALEKFYLGITMGFSIPRTISESDLDGEKNADTERIIRAEDGEGLPRQIFYYERKSITSNSSISRREQLKDERLTSLSLLQYIDQ